MLSNVYAVHDVKADCFGTPVFQKNDEVAVRSLAVVARDVSTSIGANPEDYNLYCLGSYNDGTGEVGGLDKPRLVATALSVCRENPSDAPVEVV